MQKLTTFSIVSQIEKIPIKNAALKIAKPFQTFGMTDKRRDEQANKKGKHQEGRSISKLLGERFPPPKKNGRKENNKEF